MRAQRPVVMAMRGGGWLAGLFIGLAGCDAGTPPTGSRAIVAADHLEKQRLKLEGIRESWKARPSTKSASRR